MHNTTHMKKLFLPLILALAIQSSTAQMLSPTVVKQSNILYDRLARVDTILNEYTSKNWLPGAVVIVVKDNQVAYYKGFGFANTNTKKSMQPDAIFRIASQTKAITSLAIMQLFERGKLGLDQRLSDFIPEFKNSKVLATFNPKDTTYTTVPAKREITIRDLLTHTSGIDYPMIGNDSMQAIYAKHKLPSGLGVFKESLLAKMKTLGTLPLFHSPGEKWTYGLNTDVLGCVVEIVSGESLETYFNKNIFQPLGMKDSYFNVPASKAARLVNAYTEDKGKIVDWSPAYPDVDPQYPLVAKTYFSGGAGLSCTAYDYAIFLQMLLNKGSYNGKQVLGRRTAELMLSPQLSGDLFGDDNMCLGFSLTSKKSANLKVMSEGSFAWGGFYGTTYWADPKEKLICLIMTQQTPNSHWQFGDQVMNVIYGSLR